MEGGSPRKQDDPASGVAEAVPNATEYVLSSDILTERGTCSPVCICAALLAIKKTEDWKVFIETCDDEGLVYGGFTFLPVADSKGCRGIYSSN